MQIEIRNQKMQSPLPPSLKDATEHSKPYKWMNLFIISQLQTSQKLYTSV